MTRRACLDDRELGRLALHPTGDEAAELFSHVESCELCRFALDQRRQEATDSARVWEESARGTKEPFTGPRSVPTPITMKVYRPDAPAMSQSTLLAAQGVAGGGANVAGAAAGPGEAGVTLASEGHQYIMRVMRDPKSRELWIYLLSDDEGGAGGMLVRLFGGEEAFVTDKRGRVNLGTREWPAEPELTAEVRQPLARFVLSGMQHLERPDSSVVLTSAQGDRIQVRLTGVAHGRRLSLTLLEAPGLSGLGPLRVGVRERSQGNGWRVQTLARGIATGVGVKDTESSRSGEPGLPVSSEAPEIEIYLFA